MKKRIALLLVLVLALTFVLASCGDPKPCETHTDENADGICDVCKVVIPPADLTKFNLYEYDGSEKDPASISKVVTFEFKGNPVYFGEKILVTRELDDITHDATPYNEEDNETVKEIVYDYHVYSLATGKQLVEWTERPNWDDYRDLYSAPSNDKIETITFLTPGDVYDEGNYEYENWDDEYVPDGYYVVIRELWNGKMSATLYSEDGTELAKLENSNSDIEVIDDYYNNGNRINAVNYFNGDNIDVLVDFYGDDHFVFADILYRIEADGTKTTVVDTKITDLYNRFYDSEVYYMNGKYYAVEEYGNIESVTVFDGNFNFVKYVDIPDRYDMEAEAFLLANGNVLVRYEKDLPVLYLLPEDTYDYVINGYAVTYDDVIVNTETGEVTDIEDLPFADLYVTAITDTETEAEYINFKAGVVDNIVWGNEIVDGVIAGETTTYALTNDGAIKNKFVGFDGFDFDDCYVIDAISADAIVFETPAGTYLYKADGTKIGMFVGSFEEAVINDKFIKYGNDIYDFTLTKVFTIDKDMKNVTFANDGIYYSKYTKQIDNDPDTEANEYVDGYYTWYVWNGANKELVKIYDDDASRTGFYAFNNGYVIKSFTKAVDDNPETADVNEAVAAKTTYTFYSSVGVKVDEIVETTTTTTADGKTTEVVTETYVDSSEDELFYIGEMITTTVTQNGNTPKVTTTYKIHVFW